MSDDSLILTTDPAWPWSGHGLGLPALALVALVLIMLTVWTYRGVRGAGKQRVLTLLGLRLAALVVACLTVLRPSVAFRDELHLPSILLIAADDSQSMTIRDQHNSQARWDDLRRLLHNCQPQLRRLKEEHNITVLMYRFAGDTSEYDPDGEAKGKRTDFRQMLQYLYDRHGNERFLRGLLVLSDGADNVARDQALALAAKWRTLPCPIHTFGFGQTTTTSKQRDIALTGIYPDPSPVAAKGKLTVRATVDAPGFESPMVHVRLFIDDKEVGVAQNATLSKPSGNEVKLSCNAPPTPGEIKLTLKIDPLPGETTLENNQISTYLTVTKEGISVLYIEGKLRAFEPRFIRMALSQDPNIHLFELVRETEEKPEQGDELLQLEKQHYDVIILGDINPQRLKAGHPEILSAINQLVTEKGVGLMMIGGYESFGNSAWRDTPQIADLLPVGLNVATQSEERVKMVPTVQGLQHYVMRLAEKDNAAIWNKLPELDGFTKLGPPKPGAVILAESPSKEPLLVGQMNVGTGRTLAFAGDTTWKWCLSPEEMRLHHRFWRQVVLWLAKHDQGEGNVVITPDTRRLPAGAKLGFTVKLRGRGGVEIPEKDAHFEVSVIGPPPEKSETKGVVTARERGEERGTFWKTDATGEYTLVARGWGTDVDGKPLENLPPATARFVVYQDQAEMALQAADHAFLTKLANAGGGKFHQAEDLGQFLKELETLPLPQGKPKARLWPDWRRSPSSKSVNDQLGAITSSGILVCLMLFIMLLCLEWFLRRYWGLV